MMLKLVLCTSLLAMGNGLAPIAPGMDHGAMALANTLASSYTDSLAQHPLVTKMATGGTLATAGDAIAQSQTDEPYDKRRAASFMVFDMCYRALQHVAFPIIVNECHGQYLGNVLSALHLTSENLAVEYGAVMEQTLASQLGIVPFLYYPVFFSLTGFVQGLTPDVTIQRAKDNFLPLMKRNLLFWIPVQFVQFGFIEEQLQVPFLSVAGLCWTFILSVTAGSAKSYQKQTQQETNVAPMPSRPVLASTTSRGFAREYVEA